MILAESSVWIDHLRSRNSRLEMLLLEGRIAMHSLVLGELACGSFKNRERALAGWEDLPRLASVSDHAAMQFIEDRSLMSRGIGFIDVHLLAAVAQKKTARLWSRDRRLAEVAAELGLVFHPHDA